MRSFIASLFLTFIFSLFPSPTFALDNPVIATTSATATVPQTTPTTSDTTAPSNPILIRPTDGSATGDNRPEFVWRRSTDPNGNVVIYTVYLNGVASYLGISNIGNSTGTGYTAILDGTEIKLKSTTVLTDGVYNWYVTASDGSGNVSRSTTWNLSIDTSAPHILITDIDIYHNLLLDSNLPENFADLSFNIAGPKSVNFIVATEPWSTLSLAYYNDNNELVGSSDWHVDGSGTAYPYVHFDTGRYKIAVSSFDRGGNTTALPDFYLNIFQAQVSVTIPTIPGLTPLPTLNIPYTPYSIPTLPATIAKLQTRQTLSYLALTLLAVLLLLLLILLWKKRFNLKLVNESGKPITHATIYHSIPTTNSKLSQILVTKFAPIIYYLTTSDKGLLCIPHLSRYSTLTIKLESIIYVLSISTKQRLYTIVLG